MELINATRMTVGYTMGLDKAAREYLVVVIKGTFVLPKPGEPVRLHEMQLPLVAADTFTGEPGFSAPVYEVDFAPRKQACDVLLVGSAYAPPGKQVTRSRVRLRVGDLLKTCEIVGPRVWNAGLARITPSEPGYFTQLPISYDTAFGGADRNSDDVAEHDAYLPNPVGRGWHKHPKAAWVDGKPLPITEEPGCAVTYPTDKYKPVAFGPVGRGWPQRAKYAGTYDQTWLDDVFPFLPHDFDERYYQAAPEDQQLPIPKAPLQVELEGFTPDGLRRFALPFLEAPVRVFPKKGDREDCIARLDTIVFEPDHERLQMTWRVARPLKKGLHEIAQVVAGENGRAWWQQREKLAVLAPPAPAAMSPEVPAS